MNELINDPQEQNPGPSSTNTHHEAEYVSLPSQGIYYKGPYKGLDKLLVRKLNWTDEDILTTKSYYDNGTIFDVLLKRVIIDDNGFSPLELIPMDRDAILWWLRISAFGREYFVPTKCKNKIEEENRICNAPIKAVWDLGDFDMPEIPKEYEKELMETGGVVITLPQTQLKCKISASSIGRVKEIHKAYTNKKTKEKITHDFNNTIRILSAVQEFYDKEGKVIKDRNSIYQLLMTGNNGNPLPMLDTRYIIKKSNEISLTINTKQDIICPECGHVQEGVSMPMSVHFFWPDVDEVQGIPDSFS